MDKEELVKYAPVALVVVALIFQYNLFVTPEKLEIKHREILHDISENYVPKDQYNSQYNDLKSQLNDLQKKIDKIYDVLTTGG